VGLEIYLLPSDLSQFSLSRADVIRADEQSFQSFGELCEQPFILVGLKESLPYVVLFELRNIGRAMYQRRIGLSSVRRHLAEE
jgi:hypothetical protein